MPLRVRAASSSTFLGTSAVWQRERGSFRQDDHDSIRGPPHELAAEAHGGYVMGFVKTAGVGVGVLVLIGACFGGNGDEAAPDKDKPSVARAKVESAIDEVMEETQEDTWRLNYDDHEKQVEKQLARRLPAYRLPMDTTNEALASCAEIAASKPLGQRLKSATARWSAAGEGGRRR